MKFLIIITGQSATGKTKLALDYATKYNGEIINCDSRQIYRYLDIITGKDRVLIQKNSSKIWLYDIADPKNYFSSFDYVKSALPIIKKLLDEKKTPIVVGGTFFYIQHLLYNIETENILPDWKLRNELENKSISELQNLYKKLSPKSFEQLNQSEKNNPQRLIRKIEIVNSGQAVINHLARNKIILDQKLEVENLKIQFIGLKFKTKEKLVEVIKKRVEERLKNGAIEEVKNLLKKGYRENDLGLKTIGYQQIIQFLKGKLTRNEAIAQWTTKEIQYAKRQFAFMKKDKNISWREI